ncbi:MAG: hypothetical protein ACXVPN_08740 [Bacteroidia bacterium]
MKKIITLFLMIQVSASCYSQMEPEPFSQECKDIQRKPDKFTGEVKLSTPPGQISFLKIINEKSTDYFCNIIEDQDNINNNGRGLIVVLKDGTRINKPAVEVKVDVKTPRFRHYASFKLTEDELVQLSKSEITDVKMITFEFAVEKGAELKNNLKCLINSK